MGSEQRLTTRGNFVTERKAVVNVVTVVIVDKLEREVGCAEKRRVTIIWTSASAVEGHLVVLAAFETATLEAATSDRATSGDLGWCFRALENRKKGITALACGRQLTVLCGDDGLWNCLAGDGITSWASSLVDSCGKLLDGTNINGRVFWPMNFGVWEVTTGWRANFLASHDAG